MSDNATPSIAPLLSIVADGRALSRQQAREAMAALLSGETSPVQISAFLLALRVRGETVEEITGLVEGMREASVRIKPDREGMVDLCGTGGDGSGTFNISTAAALVVAGCGVPVAKHGNRSASSLCGSADVLEQLGVPLDLEPEEARRMIEETGFAFLFAQKYHPAMRHVGPVRGELKLRTVFNILGPMTNPAGVRRQMIGVFDPAVRATICEVLGALGSERVWALHGAGGLDELSIAGVTQVTELADGAQREFEVVPEDAGVESSPLESLKGGDASVNAGIIEKLLAGEPGPHRNAVVLNAAGALVVQGLAADLSEGGARAGGAIDSGAAGKVLDRLRGRS